MSFESLKLSKRLQRRVLELGFNTPTTFQIKTLSRLVGGNSFIGIAPNGAGKTTAAILGALTRLKPSQDEAPKIIVLVPNEDRVHRVVEQFFELSNNPELHIMGLKASGSMEEEIEGLVRGVDIVVATPPRARAVYLKLGLNLNRIQLFILDDAEEMVKQGMQTNVRELAQSCGKVQYVALSTVEHQKLHLMIDDFMPFAPIIEVEELGGESIQTHELMLYQVPNFTTKTNLLLTLIEDQEVFDKIVLFVNTLHTGQKLKEKLDNKKKNSLLLDPNLDATTQQEKLQLFSIQPSIQVCIVINEPTPPFSIEGVPFLFHFELPTQPHVYVQQVSTSKEEDCIAITFATDLELTQVREIEQRLGKKLPVIPIPEEVHIYEPSTSKKEIDKEEDETRGGAFHKKKESNSKTYNYGGGTKAKMTKINKRKG